MIWCTETLMCEKNAKNESLTLPNLWIISCAFCPFVGPLDYFPIYCPGGTELIFHALSQALLNFSLLGPEMRSLPLPAICKATGKRYDLRVTLGAVLYTNTLKWIMRGGNIIIFFYLREFKITLNLEVKSILKKPATYCRSVNDVSSLQGRIQVCAVCLYYVSMLHTSAQCIAVLVPASAKLRQTKISG